MDPCTFSTESFAPRKQRTAWSEWFQPVFDVLSDDDDGQGFSGQYKVWKIGDVGLTWASAPAARTMRLPSHVRRSPIDHWVVTYCRNGPTVISTTSGQLDARPGVPFVWSLGHVSDSRRTAAERLQLYLPRDSFGNIRTSLDMAVGAAVDGRRGALLADYMVMLERSMASLNAENAARLPAAIQAMVAACLAPSADRVVGASQQIELTLMERVRQAVRRNLRSPSLGPDKLCREAAMSRSQLYRLLEVEGGAANYIRRCRLAESFTVIGDTSRSVAIGRLAEVLCFSDASTFSRAFRREFGMSPSEARNAALAGCHPTMSPKGTGSLATRSFRDCLRPS